MTDER